MNYVSHIAPYAAIIVVAILTYFLVKADEKKKITVSDLVDPNFGKNIHRATIELRNLGNFAKMGAAYVDLSKKQSYLVELCRKYPDSQTLKKELRDVAERLKKMDAAIGRFSDPQKGNYEPNRPWGLKEETNRVNDTDVVNKTKDLPKLVISGRPPLHFITRLEGFTKEQLVGEGSWPKKTPRLEDDKLAALDRAIAYVPRLIQIAENYYDQMADEGIMGKDKFFFSIVEDTLNEIAYGTK